MLIKTNVRDLKYLGKKRKHILSRKGILNKIFILNRNKSDDCYRTFYINCLSTTTMYKSKSKSELILCMQIPFEITKAKFIPTR